MIGFLGNLRPDEYHPTVYDIPIEDFRGRGLRGLVLDLDNTLVPWGSQELTPRLTGWVEQVMASGMKVCILSNNTERRGAAMADKLGLPLVSSAWKPRRRAFRRALECLSLPPEQVGVVGDQIFTDVLGGNRAGLYTVLVVPISPRELWGTRLVRRLERLVLGRLQRRVDGSAE